MAATLKKKPKAKAKPAVKKPAVWVPKNTLTFGLYRPNDIPKTAFDALTLEWNELVLRAASMPYALKVKLSVLPGKSLYLTWPESPVGFKFKKRQLNYYPSITSVFTSVKTQGHPISVLVMALWMAVKHHVPGTDLTPYPYEATEFVARGRELYEVNSGRAAHEWLVEVPEVVEEDDEDYEDEEDY